MCDWEVVGRGAYLFAPNLGVDAETGTEAESLRVSFVFAINAELCTIISYLQLH